jgi:hypothetical protein
MVALIRICDAQAATHGGQGQCKELVSLILYDKPLELG